MLVVLAKTKMTEEGATKRDLILNALIGGRKFETVYIEETELLKTGIKGTELGAYLEILRQSEYIEPNPTNFSPNRTSSSPPPSWSITAKGWIFKVEEDGFIGSRYSDIAATERENRNEKLMIGGSIGAAFFAFLILVYYIVSFCIDHSHHCH